MDDSISDNNMVSMPMSPRNVKSICYNPATAINMSDPTTEWIPNSDLSVENNKDDTFHDVKLGLVSSSVYFENNFSPLTSFTDDSECGRNDDDFMTLPTIALNTYRLPWLARDKPNSRPHTPSLSLGAVNRHVHSPSIAASLAYPRLFDPHSGRPASNDDDSPRSRLRPNPPRTFSLPSLMYDDSSLTSDSGGSNSDAQTPTSLESQSPSYRGKSRGRKTLNDAATKVLTDWIVEHQDDPYPTQSEKEMLAKRAGLTVKQVVDWLTNTRKRRLHPVLSGKRAPKTALDYIFLRNARQPRYSLDFEGQSYRNLNDEIKTSNSAMSTSSSRHHA